MNINKAIVQGILKSANSDHVQIVERQAELNVDQRLIKLGNDVLEIYGKVSNNYGTFDSDVDTYQFPKFLQEYLSGQRQIFEFSISSTRLIAAKMGESMPSTGGYVLFLHYENQGRNWLMIVMLKLKPQTGIDQSSLDLTETLILDVQHLHEAARIDLDKWSAGDQPYLSFIKRRSSQDEVTKYFRRALGCTEYTDSRHNTIQTLKAVDAFCDEMDWSPERKQEARRATYNYCHDKSQNREAVNIQALSAHIYDQDPEAFIDFIREQDYAISETFSPHPASYSRFKRISGQMGSIKVSFDVDDVLNHVVNYQSVSNTLTITNVSAKLAQEIQKAKGDDSVTQ